MSKNPQLITITTKDTDGNLKKSEIKISQEEASNLVDDKSKNKLLLCPECHGYFYQHCNICNICNGSGCVSPAKSAQWRKDKGYEDITIKGNNDKL